VTGCEHVRPALGGYVLGGLEQAETSAVREHLTTCARCAAEHARLAGLPELLTLAEGLDAADASPPDAVEERLLDAVARERGGGRPARRPRRRARLPWLAGAAAAAAAVVAALVIALGTGGDSAPRRYQLMLRPVGASAGSGRAELEAVPGGTAVRLWVRDLPADPNAVYEVRCEAPDWSASAGTFRTDTRGRAYVELTTAARRGEYDAIRVLRRSHGRGIPVMSSPLS
jgi:hypothetical protein